MLETLTIAAAAPHHAARRRAAGIEGAAEVRVQDDAPVLVRHPRQKPVACDAGVVHEDVDVARLLDEALASSASDTSACTARAPISDATPSASSAPDRSRGRRRAGAGQLGSDRLADPARAACDERRPAFERAELRHRLDGLFDLLQAGDVVDGHGLHGLVDSLQ